MRRYDIAILAAFAIAGVIAALVIIGHLNDSSELSVQPPSGAVAGPYRGQSSIPSIRNGGSPDAIVPHDPPRDCKRPVGPGSNLC